MVIPLVTLLLFLPGLAVAESQCKFQGTYIDSTHSGLADPPTLVILGEIFNFTNFQFYFENNATVVVTTSHASGWYELQYSHPVSCGLAKIDGANIELTEPLATCATEWPTNDVAFAGVAISGQQFCDLWILGVFGALIGTFLSTLGLGLQKLTHENLKAEGREIENYCHHPLWLLGIGCLVVDAVLDVWTFGLAPASLLAPMASMVLVWNVLTSPCLVGEQLTKRGLVGTLVIISGSICATIFSQHDTPSYTLADFGERWSSAEVIIYELCVVFIFCGSKYGLHRMSINESARQLVNDSFDSEGGVEDGVEEEEKQQQEETSTTDISLEESLEERRQRELMVEQLQDLGFEKDAAEAAASVDPVSSQISTKKIDSMTLNYVEGSRPYLISQFVMAMMSGMLGGQSIIFAKTVVELLKATFFGPENEPYNAFASWPFYLFLGALICVLMTQTQVLNMAMHNFDSLNVIPIFITFYQVFGVIGGAIYYKEFDDFGVTQAFMFPIGCSISFCGIYILSRPPEEDENGEMEEMIDVDDEAPTKNGTRSAPALTSGGSVMTRRERYASSVVSIAAGPMFGFLNSSAVVDRDGISQSVKQRRASTMKMNTRRASKSMNVSRLSQKEPTTPTRLHSAPQSANSV